MLRSVTEIVGYGLSAEDGDLGSVDDFYFDDDRWTIRYLVAEAGNFWTNHRVLLSPIAFRQHDGATHRFHVALTREKVKNSPGIDLAKPVSRQYEREYYQYYGWPAYWGPPGGPGWGEGPFPSSPVGSPPAEGDRVALEESGDPHLRSVREVSGYHIVGVDGELGHVADFIVEDETWAIRYLVVDTSNWWMGKKVLVAPLWATAVDWSRREVHLALTRESIKACPDWNPETPVNREYEVRLYDYYGRPAYFGDTSRPQDSSKEIRLP